LAGPAAELRADQTASDSADERAGVFLRSLAGFGVPAHAATQHSGEPRTCHTPHDDPVSDFNESAFPFWPMPALQLIAKIGAKLCSHSINHRLRQAIMPPPAPAPPA